MPIESNLPGGSQQVNTQTTTTTQTEKTTDVTPQTPLGFGQTGDTQGVSGGKGGFVLPNTNNPTLPQPQGNPPSNLGDAFNSQPPDPEIAAEIEAMYADEFENFFNQGKIKEGEKNKLNNLYKLGRDGEIQDPKLQAAFDNAKQNVKQKLKSKFPNIKEPFPRNSRQNQQMFANAKRQELKIQLMDQGYVDDKGNLNAEGRAIQHAILSDSIPPGSTAEKVLTTLNQTMETALGMSDIEIDSGSYLGRIGSQFESAVLAKAPEGQEKLFEFLFNHPDQSNPLQAKVDQARAEALAELQEKYGLPKDFKPEENSLLYDAKLNGTFYSSLDKYLNKESQIQNSADKQAIVAFLKAQLKGTEGSFDKLQFNTSLSLDAIKELATAAKAAGLAEVQQLYGVPKSWGPDTTKSLNDYIGGPGFTLVRSLEQFAKIMQSKIDTDTALSSAEKLAMTEFMKFISEALTDLNELMYMIQATEAEASRLGSEAQLGMINDKISKTKNAISKRETMRKEQAEQVKKNEEARKEQEAKEATMEWLGPVIFVVTTIVAVAVAVLSFGTGAAAAALMIAVAIALYCASTISIEEDKDGNKKTVMGEVMKTLSDGINKVAHIGVEKDAQAAYQKVIAAGGTEAEAIAAKEKVYDDDVFGTVVESFLKIAVIAFIVVAAVASGNVMLGMMVAGTLIAESGLIESLLTDTIESIPGGKDWMADNPWFVMVIATLMIIALTVAAGGKGGGGGKILKGVGKAGKAVGRAGKSAGRLGARIARGAAKAAKNPKAALKSGARAAASAAARGGAAAVRGVRTVAVRTKNAITETGRKAAQSARDAIQETLQELSKLKAKLAKILEALSNMSAKSLKPPGLKQIKNSAQRTWENLKTSSRAANATEALSVMAVGTESVSSMIHNARMFSVEKELAALSKKIADIVEDLGLTESEIEKINAIIDLFEKFIKSLQENQEKFSEQIATIQESMPKTYKVGEATTEGWDAIAG